VALTTNHSHHTVEACLLHRPPLQTLMRPARLQVCIAHLASSHTHKALLMEPTQYASTTGMEPRRACMAPVCAIDDGVRWGGVEQRVAFQRQASMVQ
jgi:hypothetical protein